jgi:hypothetical protein
MILGLIIILLAGILNVLLLAVPLLPLNMSMWWAIDLMQKLHWIAWRGALMIVTVYFVFAILMAACIQLWVWGLAPRAEPARWILAVSAFGVGEACLLIQSYKTDTSQWMRRFGSWLSAARVCGFSLLCLAAYTSVTIHGALATLPGRVLHFVVGGGT